MPTVSIPIERSTEPEIQKTAESFAHGLMLVADQFIKDKADKKVLKEIISRIPFNEPANKGTSTKTPEASSPTEESAT